MRIGIYGGSFDPPHKGHIRAAQAFLAEAQLDRLFVIPAGNPPHKSLEGGADAADRLAMTRLAFLPISPKISVSDREIAAGGVSFSYLTLEAIAKENPQAELFLFVGTDMFLSFETWREFERIFTSAVICVMPRDEETDEILQKKALFENKYRAKILILREKPYIISSSAIRREIAEAHFSHALSPAVNDYIEKKNLFGSFGNDESRTRILSRLIKTLPGDRLGHILAVEREIASLCDMLSVKNMKDELCRAALCHDLTRCQSTEWQLGVFEKYGWKVDEDTLRSPIILHGFSAALLAEHEFGLAPWAVEAIRFHTIGRKSMSLPEKILYFADYIEETRRHEACRRIREEFYSGFSAHEDKIKWLNACLGSAVRQSILNLQKEGKPVHPNSLAALESLEEEQRKESS